MPEPTEGETMQTWMPKCIKTFLAEHPEAESQQAVAACINMGREKGVKDAPEEKK